MKRAMWVALGTGAAISSAAAIGIGASSALAPEPVPVTRTQFASGLAAMDSRREDVLARCEERAATDRELCRAEAAADELVRAADLEANFRRTRDAARAAQRARVEARYYVERAKCGAVGGAKRDGCLIAAHAVRGSALLELAAGYENRS
jgi:hypothetical protein